MMIVEPLREIALVFSAATLFGWLAHRWRQPLIMAYLLTGFLLATMGFLHTEEQILFSGYAKIGVSLLLFLVGLKLSLRDLRLVGPEALRLGLGQILITFLIMINLALLLRFSLVEGVLVSLALTLSSTIIVVKLLTEKKELASLHGKLTIGLLLVQDLVVLLVMAGLTGFQLSTGSSLTHIAGVISKSMILFFTTVWLAKKPVPWLFDQLSRSTELLFIAAIGWCFTAATVAEWLGFSPEIGAFLAGVGLANVAVGVEIAAKVQPLRDFFLGIFFILLGAEMGLTISTVNWMTVIIFTPIVVFVKPLVVWFILIWMGYRQRTAFLCAIILGQISEFSLILVSAGEELALLPPGLVGTMVVIGAVSIGLSASLTHAAERIYHRTRRYLWPKPRSIREELFSSSEEYNEHLVLLGCDRSGHAVLPILININLPLVVVDFNPDVIEHLTAERINTLYGDVGDEEILEKLNLKKAKIIISTVRDWQDNMLLLNKIGSDQQKPIVVLTAADKEEAIEFYNQGADYVIVPEIAGGEQLGSLLTHHRLGRDDWGRVGKNHYHQLIGRVMTR